MLTCLVDFIVIIFNEFIEIEIKQFINNLKKGLMKWNWISFDMTIFIKV